MGAVERAGFRGGEVMIYQTWHRSRLVNYPTSTATGPAANAEAASQRLVIALPFGVTPDAMGLTLEEFAQVEKVDLRDVTVDHLNDRILIQLEHPAPVATSAPSVPIPATPIPNGAVTVLAYLLPPGKLEKALGDLDLDYRRVLPALGEASAKRWLRIQIVKLIAHEIWPWLRSLFGLIVALFRGAL